MIMALTQFGHLETREGEDYHTLPPTHGKLTNHCNTLRRKLYLCLPSFSYMICSTSVDQGFFRAGFLKCETSLFPGLKAWLRIMITQSLIQFENAYD